MVSVTCSWRATGCRTIYRSCWINGCAHRTAGTVSSQNKNNHTVRMSKATFQIRRCCTGQEIFVVD